MRRLRVIGIGCTPEHLTREAADAITSVDYVIAADKGDDDPLLALRRAVCVEQGVPLIAVPDPERERDDPPDYRRAVADWHVARTRSYADVLRERPGDVGFLVWGDPAFYDSTIRIAHQLAAEESMEIDVVPGISAVQLLAARHRLVLHGVGRPFLVTTGRRLEVDARTHDELVVMLDGEFRARDLAGRWHVWWGANLGTATERLCAGPLPEVTGQVLDARAAARASAGWVMDTYLLRRQRDNDLGRGV